MPPPFFWPPYSRIGTLIYFYQSSSIFTCSTFPCNQEGFIKVEVESFSVPDSQYPVHFEDGPIDLTTSSSPCQSSAHGAVDSPAPSVLCSSPGKHNNL